MLEFETKDGPITININAIQRIKPWDEKHTGILFGYNEEIEIVEGNYSYVSSRIRQQYNKEITG